MDIDDVSAHIRAALQDRSEQPWFPGLAEPLARVAWNQLARDVGITQASYGTARLLRRNPSEARLIVARCGAGPNRGADADGGGIPVEILPDDLARQVAGHGVRFLETNRVVGTVAPQLEEALSLLNLVPTVWPTVSTLVGSLHIIDPGGDETDVSFSDPAVPFSVFISVPPTWSEVAALRVAEAVLHEAMHLQLTLVERVVPLVLPNSGLYYSPWRDEQRNSVGILQALYVFGVIRSFLRAIPVQQSSPAGDHVVNRIAQIDSQIEQVQRFRECDELTPDGAALVGWLIDMPTKDPGGPSNPSP